MEIIVFPGRQLLPVSQYFNTPVPAAFSDSPPPASYHNLPLCISDHDHQTTISPWLHTEPLVFIYTSIISFHALQQYNRQTCHLDLNIFLTNYTIFPGYCLKNPKFQICLSWLMPCEWECSYGPASGDWYSTSVPPLYSCNFFYAV